MKHVLAVLILLFSNMAQAGSETEATTCDEAAAWARLEEVSLKYRDKIRIPHLMAMMTDTYRTPIREYYAAAKMCPTRKVVSRYIKDLQIIGYPNDYLPAILNGLGSNHGLKMYELGDSWNRELVTEELRQQDATVDYLHQHIAIMGLLKQREQGLTLYSVGTGSIIGRQDSSVFIATADHVVRNNAENISLEEICQRMVFHFPTMKGRHFNGKSLVIANQKVDFAICEVELPADALAVLNTQGLQVSTRAGLQENLPLMTMGYNSHNAVPGKAHVERSEDCRLFASQPRVLENKNWALPTGCDAAPGDSGSPVLDKATKEIVGFMVQTTELKSGASSAELKHMQEDPQQRDGLWSELSMISPITKIREVLCEDQNQLLQDLLKCTGTKQ